MSNVMDVLKERGYFDNATHEEELRELLEKESVTFYIGFDGTADSLTLGHYQTIMAMKHMQAHGHVPIVLLGGGTTMIGDPSGRNDMRNIMSEETIQRNAQKFLDQFHRLLDFSPGKAITANNKDWLLNLNFVDFMRTIGVHFNVNRMLTYDCYKNRMADGLTFFEMGYMLMQSYDFLELYRKHGCRLQMGGSDQWANMLGGVELVDKLEGKKVFCMTMKLLVTADGTKMGKSMKGALWLDKEKTSPYELFQYMRNTDDRDVERFLALLTMLPMEEVRRLGALKDAELNHAKEVLAYEIVKDIHGKEEADRALETSHALFGGKGNLENAPFTEMKAEDFQQGIGLLQLLTNLGLTKSNGEARRLVEQGGIFLDDNAITDVKKTITEKDFTDGKLMIRKGKKVYHQVRI